MGLALSKHSLSEDISESLLLIDSGIFFRMVGFCVHIQWDIAFLCVRVVLPTCKVKRDIKEIDLGGVSLDCDLQVVVTKDFANALFNLLYFLWCSIEGS